MAGLKSNSPYGRLSVSPHFVAHFIAYFIAYFVAYFIAYSAGPFRTTLTDKVDDKVGAWQ